MNAEYLYLNNLEAAQDGFISKNAVLPGEVEGVNLECISIKGPGHIHEKAYPGSYDIILFLKGVSSVEVKDTMHSIGGQCIARMPYNSQYVINVQQGEEIHFLRIRKYLDDTDHGVILKNIEAHSDMYIKALDECPVYTENIKSNKTVNRMLLPEGMVPRFCMGSVLTEGPDSVAEHEHPMLEQLFFGLEGCKCKCIADGEKALLTENMFLHIPLGSKHSVSVEWGDKLAYIWMDFFLTLEGQKYMDKQHQIDI